jgi:lincosamide nucleotidyltransferase A/C/D/E
MVTAEDAIHIYQKLTAHGIPIWLSGGWGIDALLGEETRPHKDLDFFVLLDDVVRVCRIMACSGYRLKELWSENRWALDSARTRVPTAFVLRDSAGRELDLHAIQIDAQGNGNPTWAEAEDFILSIQDLTTMGRIAGMAVPCISFEMQMRAHAGYTLPELQRRDLARLHERFGAAHSK